MRINKSIVAHAVCAAGIIGAVAVAQRTTDQREQQPAGGQGMPEIKMPEFAKGHPLADLNFENMGEMMAACMAKGQPGPSHEVLKNFVGSWNTTTKMWMDPTAEPMVSKGTARFRPVLDGRFIQGEHSGSFEMPGMGEMQMQGVTYLGFDNFTKLYNMLWMDNHSTGIYSASGSMSPDGSVIAAFGEMNDPMTGEIGKPVQWNYRIESPEKIVFEWKEVAYGEPFTMLEVTYDRASR